jgi:hypothetical protein
VVAIRKAYRHLAKSCHPDVRIDKENAAVEFRELTRIYEIALTMARAQKPKPRKAPPPAKPPGPIKHKGKVAPIDDFEFDMFGEVSRVARAPPEVFEYGGTVIIEMSKLDGYGCKIGAFQFEVPPKTKNGQKFRFNLSVGIVEITLVSERK